MAEKSELRLQEHAFRLGAKVIEVWYRNRLIATVAGADGPGVRVLSAHTLTPSAVPSERSTPVNVIEVSVRVGN